MNDRYGCRKNWTIIISGGGNEQLRCDYTYDFCPATVPANRPRFLPFKVLPRRPLNGTDGRVCTSAERASTKSGGGYADCMVGVATASRVPTLVPSRSESLCRSNGVGTTDGRPHTSPWGGRSTHTPKNFHGGRAPVSSAPPRFPRKIRPPPRLPEGLPGNCHKKGMYRLPRSAKNRRPTARTTRHEPRLGSFISGGYDTEEAKPLRRGPDYAGGCSPIVGSEGGVCGGVTWDVGTAPFVATRPDEEASDGVMHGGLLWRESGFGREIDLATKGVPQGTTEACQPVSS